MRKGSLSLPPDRFSPDIRVRGNRPSHHPEERAGRGGCEEVQRVGLREDNATTNVSQLAHNQQSVAVRANQCNIACRPPP